MFIRSKIQFFESKSQHIGNETFKNCVVYQIKDTIFWKQITTPISRLHYRMELFIRSKIQFFESKSQQILPLEKYGMCCLSDQRYNFLKANHNISTNVLLIFQVVYQIKDTIFWKQITTTLFKFAWLLGCLSDQRYNFLKANHNPIDAECSLKLVVYQIKDTIFWKQITTRAMTVHSQAVLFIRSKIQFFESKSQRSRHVFRPGQVVYLIKDTIFWKQITTTCPTLPRRWRLFIRSKIQFFESKSQRSWSASRCRASCLSDQRYNFLKANHN